jgi:HD-like signal output (HDOD) protein/CheY-like chemotaxis protein
MRLLLVDDEQYVLDGLRNQLRARRREWEMSFACGGEAALPLLEQLSFDVVVSDMHMPRLDGAALLTRVKELQPRAVRIILSGQTETESAMKTVFVAHRFLSKPCDGNLLRDVLERAFGLGKTLAAPELRAAAGEISALPRVPRTYLSLCQVLSRPNASMADLIAVVQGDVGLCAKILQVVNSPFFGLPRRISSLQESVSYLGTETVKNLALAIEAFTAGPGGAPPEELQRHSLLTAQLARRFMAGDRVRSEEAFVAGLLHAIGQLIPVPAGTAASSIDTSLLGGYLLDLWGLPHSVVEAVVHHRNPGGVAHEGFDVVDAVYLASRLASRHLAPAEDELDQSYLAHRGVSGERLEGWNKLARTLVDNSTAAT